ncbi:MAG: LEA type 2 family protein [Syntrophotaleaceae bacterium]
MISAHASRTCRMAITAVLFMVLAGCATLRPVPPEVSLFGLQLENLTLSHAILSADLSLYNPNDSAITIKRVRYALSLMDIRIAHGQSAESVRIEPHETGRLAVRLSSSYLNLLRTGQQIQGRENIPFTIEGEITVGGFGVISRTIPFEEEGVIPLQAWSRLTP